MTIQELADKLVAYCRNNDFSGAHNELYAADVVSIEPSYAQSPEVKGIEAVRRKSKMFMSSIKEWHGGHVSDPMVAGNHFSVVMSMDITTQDGQRFKMEEIAVYEAKDGKVVKEQFFF